MRSRVHLTIEQSAKAGLFPRVNPFFIRSVGICGVAEDSNDKPWQENPLLSAPNHGKRN